MTGPAMIKFHVERGGKTPQGCDTISSIGPATYEVSIMRRPAYDSNVAFEGKIKSMRLISEMIGFGPMPAPDREVEQRLTLNSRGKIWFSNYLYGDGVKQKLHRKECSTISPTDADYIL